MNYAAFFMYVGLLELDNSKVILVVDNRTVSTKFAGSTSSLPIDVLLNSWTLVTDHRNNDRSVSAVGNNLKISTDFLLIHIDINIVVGVHFEFVISEQCFSQECV